MTMANLLVPMFVADLLQNERELLNGGDDDLLAVAQELPQIARRVPHDQRLTGPGQTA